MKQSVKKPRPAKKTAGNRVPSKKKKRKKPGTEDKFRAVLVAGILILAAAFSSLAIIYLHSAKVRSQPLNSIAPDEAPLQKGNEDLASEKRNSPPAAPVTQTPVPAEKTAPVQSVPPVPSAQSAAPIARPAPQTASSPAVSKPAAKSQPPENRTVTAAALPPAGVSERPPEGKGVLVFVIDDAGHNLRDLEPFLKFPGPLTIAVLPGLAYSAEAARRIRAAGKEVFLHQPMEALGGQNPGPGAIRAGMNREEIRAIINRNLDEIWPVAGINNHEGSRITMDEDAMETVLSLCRERGILFLDSRTTSETASARTARRLGMTIGERDVFVDNIQERESMKRYIHTGLLKAEQKGSAIMIGHVWSSALAPLLTELFPDLREQGYSFSPASKIIGGANL